jgi:hypothetical protein
LHEINPHAFLSLSLQISVDLEALGGVNYNSGDGKFGGQTTAGISLADGKLRHFDPL